MPTYILANPTWRDVIPHFLWGNNHGAMFTLTSSECAAGNPDGLVFPAGYCSLANPFWSYLLALDGSDVCRTAEQVGHGMNLTGDQLASHVVRYGRGILCKQPLRRLTVWSLDLTWETAENYTMAVFEGSSKIARQVRLGRETYPQ